LGLIATKIEGFKSVLPTYGMRCTWIVLKWCTQWRICWHSNTKYCHLIYMIFLVCFVTYFIIMIQCCDVPVLKRNGDRELLLENKKCIEKCL
jgi:hypothetical protein